jgi:hypothetical protein
MSRRRELIAALPGATQEGDDGARGKEEERGELSARARDLDRMYERVLRARIASDDAALRVERSDSDGFRAGTLVTAGIVVALAISLVYVIVDRQRLLRREKKLDRRT